VFLVRDQHYANSSRRAIEKLVETSSAIDDNDRVHQQRSMALARNIRMYAIELLQNCAIKTRRVPQEQEIQRARHERQQQTENERAIHEKSKTSKPAIKAHDSGWRPTVDRQLLERTDEFEPFAQQYHQVVEFIRQAESAGRTDEVKILQVNLKELEQVMKRMKT
jgi:hypothetical protein